MFFTRNCPSKQGWSAIRFRREGEPSGFVITVAVPEVASVSDVSGMFKCYLLNNN